MAKVILFDFDGTIADSYEGFLAIVEQLVDKYKLPKVSRLELEQLRDEGAEVLVKKFKIPFYKIPFIARDMKKLQRQQLDRVKPFVGLSKVLLDLKDQGYRLGIVTSNSKENVNRFLKNNDCNFFDYIQSDVGLFGKANSIKKFLSKYRFSKDEVVYVGDEIRDIQACKKVGIKIVAVTWGFNSKPGLEKYQPDITVNKVGELLAVVN